MARWGCKGTVLCAVGGKRHFLLFHKEGTETHSFPLGPATMPIKAHKQDGSCVNDMRWSPDGVPSGSQAHRTCPVVFSELVLKPA